MSDMNCYFCKLPIIMQSNNIYQDELYVCYHCPKVDIPIDTTYHPQWCYVCAKYKISNSDEPIIGSIYFRNISMAIYNHRGLDHIIGIAKYNLETNFQIIINQFDLQQNIFEIPPDVLEQKIKLLVMFQ